MSGPVPTNLLDRLIAEAQADDYSLAPDQAGARRGPGWLAAAVLVLIGALLVTAALQRQTVAPAAQERRDDLVQRVREAQAGVEQSQERAAALRGSVSQLQQLAASGLGPEFTEQLAALEIATGFVGLQGPGAVVSLRDGTPPLPRGVTVDEARVLDVDMQMVVNGLWQAGAQAIAINGIRLTSTTAIRTAGEAILVDFRPLVPPYTIDAVGPADLADRFEATPANDELAGLREDYGIESEVAAATDVSVPASTANLPTRAEVVEGGGE
jgi:uncharacterized protein YlxW (UPF0749 family)